MTSQSESLVTIYFPTFTDWLDIQKWLRTRGIVAAMVFHVSFGFKRNFVVVQRYES